MQERHFTPLSVLDESPLCLEFPATPGDVPSIHPSLLSPAPVPTGITHSITAHVHVHIPVYVYSVPSTPGLFRVCIFSLSPTVSLALSLSRGPSPIQPSIHPSPVNLSARG